MASLLIHQERAAAKIDSSQLVRGREQMNDHAVFPGISNEERKGTTLRRVTGRVRGGLRPDTDGQQHCSVLEISKRVFTSEEVLVARLERSICGQDYERCYGGVVFEFGIEDMEPYWPA